MPQGVDDAPDDVDKRPRKRGHDDACPRSASDEGREGKWTAGARRRVWQLGAVQHLLAPSMPGGAVQASSPT
jgi:hypothetical protein